MLKQFLHRANIIPSLQEIGREGMPQHVATHLFGQCNFYSCILNSPLLGIFVDMMPTHFSTARVH
jgi:hypothetical protein